MTNKYKPRPRRSMAEAFKVPEVHAKADPDNRVLMNFRLDEDLHRRLKTYCFINEISMREVLTDLIEGFLDEKAPEQQTLPKPL